MKVSNNCKMTDNPGFPLALENWKRGENEGSFPSQRNVGKVKKKLSESLCNIISEIVVSICIFLKSYFHMNKTKC